MAWICYAHPPSKNGKPCHHVNELGIKDSLGLSLICCEKCGCTKIASDVRRAKMERNRDGLHNPDYKEN